METLDTFVGASEAYFEAVKRQILEALFNAIDTLDAVSSTIIQKAAADIDAALARVDLTSQDSIAKVQSALNAIADQAQDDLYNYWRQVKEKLDSDATDTELMAAAIKKNISDALDKYAVDIDQGVTRIVERVLPLPAPPPTVGATRTLDTDVGWMDAIKAIPGALLGAGKSIAMFGKLAELTDLMHSPEQTIVAFKDHANSLLTRTPEGTTKLDVKLVSWTGALLGSPMGFIPFMTDFYRAGLGETFANSARYIYQPTKMGAVDNVTAAARGIIDAKLYMERMRTLGFSDDDALNFYELGRQMIPINDLLALNLRGKLTDEELALKLAALNVSPDDFDYLKTLAKKILGVGELISLWLRKEVDEPELDAKLTAQGIEDDDIIHLKSLAFYIPGVQDLIHMAVREAFTPDIAEKFGQYEDYPPELTQYANMQGLSKEWAQRYWAAHWELPSAQMGFEMLHRGVIDQATLNVLLRALDVMPYWRDKLTAIAYEPYTRVDIRRMHKMKLMTREEVVRAHLDIGYDADKAEKLTQFTEELNSEEAKLEKQAERDLTASEVLNAYSNQAIAGDETVKLLTDLGYDEHEITLKLVLAELPGMKRTRDKRVAIINQRLLYGRIDLNGAVDALNKMDMTQAEQDYILADWQLDLELQQFKSEDASAKQRSTQKAASRS